MYLVSQAGGQAGGWLVLNVFLKPGLSPLRRVEACNQGCRALDTKNVV